MSDICDGRNHISKYICLWDEVLHISCYSGKVISLVSALYGRNNDSLCLDDSSPPDNTDCAAANTFPVVRQSCDGRPSCSIYTRSFAEFGTDPCPDSTKYLEVEYTCYNPGKKLDVAYN